LNMLIIFGSFATISSILTLQTAGFVRWLGCSAILIILPLTVRSSPVLETIAIFVG